MNTLKLYSKLKVNQRKAKETKCNHTRIILAFFATIIAILFLASCATDKSKYHFHSSEDALSNYHLYLSQLQKKKSLSSDEFVVTVSTWTELRDSVYNYISRDSAFYGHTYLSSQFYTLHDSIRTEMFRLAVGQDRTLKDVLRVKKSTSQYGSEKDIQNTFNSAKAYFSSLDSLEVFKTDKVQTLVIYRKFFSDINNVEVHTLNDLKSLIRTEDRLFRTFLTHINEYGDVSLVDITKGTERLCKSIYKYATDGELDAKDVMVYMSMRTNRRLIQNTQSCIESIRRKDKLSDKQQEAYYWMLIQPYIAIDTFGMAVLTPEQDKMLVSYADEIQRMEQTHKLGKYRRTLSEMSNLILKLYISGL